MRRWLSLAIFVLFLPTSLLSYNLETLSKSKSWHDLLHFKNTQSEIIEQEFFLSPNGKTSPKEELNATLQALQKDPQTQCQFPARTKWIKSQITNISIPKSRCEELEKTIQDLNASFISLIFPSAHINSPASMYGHTFLRINSDINKPLLANAINYAADTNEENAFLFAYRGLTGKYKGKYSMLPYYKKISEYSSLEKRDMWEYQLNFTKEEIHKILLHSYELRLVSSEYYFFNKNCSYNILWLLQVGRESLDLISKFDHKAIPIDTIKILHEQNAIKNLTYRPSKAKTIHNIYDEINNKTLALKFVKDHNLSSLKNISQKEKQNILEFSVELLKIDRIKNKLDKKEYIKNLLILLKQRSTLGQNTHKKIKMPPNPTKSHPSNKLEVSIENDSSTKITIKPAFHDIYDISEGFISGAFIDFFKIGISKNKNENLKIDELTFIDIKSLAPYDDIFEPLSWKVKLGFERFRNNLDLLFNIGAGYTYGNDAIYSYIMPQSTIVLGHNDLLGGIEIGSILNHTKFKLGLLNNLNFSASKNKLFDTQIFLTHKINKNISLNYKLQYSYDDDQIQKEDKKAIISFFYYF